MELLSISDIASEYKISRYSIWNWYRRDINFPSPVQHIGKGRIPLFCKNEIDKYIKINK